jgi:hypothetical protein
MLPFVFRGGLDEENPYVGKTGLFAWYDPGIVSIIITEGFLLKESSSKKYRHDR